MGNLIHAGLFCCLLFVKLGVCLSLRDEDVSDSFLQVLMRKLHEQDEKFAAIEANTKLDHKDFVSRILTLEEKLKESDYKQKKLEITIENMDKIIKELEIKTWTKNENNLNDEHPLGKQKKENPDSEPVATVFENTMDTMEVEEDQSATVESRQRRILNGGVYPSKLSSIFTHCCKILKYLLHCYVIFNPLFALLQITNLLHCSTCNRLSREIRKFTKFAPHVDI